MAIDVMLAASKSARGKGETIDTEISIENGPYHFLLPEIIEMKGKNGKFIDQYGDVFFEPHAIKPLLTLFKRAQGRAQKMKKVEFLVIGTEKKSKSEVRIEVRREEILGLIGKLISAAEQAEVESKYLIFLGD